MPFSFVAGDSLLQRDLCGRSLTPSLSFSPFPQTETPAGKAGAQQHQGREWFGNFALAATAADEVGAEARGREAQQSVSAGLGNHIDLQAAFREVGRLSATQVEGIRLPEVV